MSLASMSVASVSAGDEPSPLARRLVPLIEAHQGDVAVAVENLKTGERFAWRVDEAMPTASLVKFPILIELYRQADAGQVDLDRTLTLRETDKVPGSGILTAHFTPGATFTLRDAARLMIAFSDNTATNLVLDQIGLASTTETMRRLGCPNTSLHHKVFLGDTTSIAPERSRQFGLGSTTAAEMLRLFAALERKELASEKSCEAMLAHLKACEDHHKFRRFLPEGTVVAFKTGSLDEVRTAAGILYAPAGPVALCVLTARNKDHSWAVDNAGDRLCADVAREVYAHFAPSAEPKP